MGLLKRCPQCGTIITTASLYDDSMSMYGYTQKAVAIDAVDYLNI